MPAPRLRLPIRAFLILLAATLLAPLILFSVVVTSRFFASERDRYQEHAIDAARRAATAIDRDVAGVEVALQVLANSTQLDARDLAAFHARMLEAGRLLNATLVLREPSSQQLLNTHEPPGRPLPGAADRAGDRLVLQTGRPYVSDLIRGQLTGHWIVNVTVPVQRGGEVPYLLSASIGQKRFHDILQSQELPPDWNIAVIDRVGRIVARRAETDSDTGQPISDDLQDHTTGHDAVWNGRNREGQPILAAFTRSDLIDFRVVVGAPDAMLTAAWQRSLTLLALYGVVAAAASGLFALWLGRLISRPLRSLSESGTLIGGEEALPSPGTPILEIQGLSEVLRTASSGLRDRARQRDAVELRLREVAAALEARVAELRESEARFKTFALVMPHQLWTALPNGEVEWSNGRAGEYSGVSPEDLRGLGWTQIVHPDDLPGTAQDWRRALSSGMPYETQFRLRRADGVWRWHIARALPVVSDDQVVRWVGTNTDIEDQKGAQAELIRLNGLLADRVATTTAERDQVWRQSRDLLCVADATGRLLGVNPAWHATLGWSDAALLETNLAGLAHPDDRANTVQVLQALARDEAAIGFTNRLRCADGGHRWLSWNAVPAKGMIYAVLRDVSEDRQAAEILRRTEDALRQAQKMEAVGQLTGGLAHDFNNLLTGIAGSLELLQTRVAQGRIGEMDRYVTSAQGAAKRAASLTHRLLAFSRRQTLDPKPVDASRLAADLEDLIQRTVGPAVTVQVVPADRLWTTLCDPNQLENALLNLAINARDAMPEGGALRIETTNLAADGDATEQHDLPPGEYVTVRVIDEGTGMTPEVMARAFDPFFTTKPIGQGTGLGLSMIYGFVRQSGGQIRLRSRPGEGTTVSLHLPRHHGPAEAGAEAAPSAPPRAEPGQAVLVVDDDATIRALTTDVLEDLGYAVIPAEDGPTGLETLRSDQRIDLLVTDVGLPGGMNGRQLADAARSCRPELPVLFITGYAGSATLDRASLADGMHVMAKPFPMEALAVRVGAILEQAVRPG